MKLIIRLNYVCVCNGWHLGTQRRLVYLERNLVKKLIKNRL